MSLDVHPVLDVLTEYRRTEGSMNTATMTFATFLENAAIVPWVLERTHIVAEKYPSRVLILNASKPEGEQHAEPPAARGEWVEIGVEGTDPQSLAAAVTSLALADAPIVLTWLGRRIAGDPRFAALYTIARTKIVSTSADDVSASALRDLIRFYDAHQDAVVHDIAYLRITPWREVIAEFFDDPTFACELQRLRRVEITAGSDSEMFYLISWLASRLGWAPCASDRFCNSAGEDITFVLHREGEPRRIRRVVLQSEGTTFLADVTDDDPNAVCLEINGEKSRERRSAPLHNLDIASLFERALLGSYRQNVFRETLAMARDLIDRQGQSA